MKNIIFICRHNRFRSQFATGFFNKLNKNKKIRASGAGIFQGIPVAPNVKKVAKEFGIKTDKPKGIKETDLVEADLFVIVANDVPKELFNRAHCSVYTPRAQEPLQGPKRKAAKKVVVWKIPDTGQENIKRIREIAKDINKKVQGLVKELEERK